MKNYEKKYELTDETMQRCGHTLHRIRALRSFGNVSKGNLGGWIEDEHNLSHEDTCWVYSKAIVYENARVLDDAKVCGQALVYGRATLFNYAKIDEHAVVSGDAYVYELACVGGEAVVTANAQIHGTARVNGNVIVRDTAKIYNNAKVCGTATIFGRAILARDAVVQSTSDYLIVWPIGSRNDTTTFYRDVNGGVMVKCGCFVGTLNEFEQAVQRKHAQTHHGKAYMAAIQTARVQLGKEDATNEEV